MEEVKRCGFYVKRKKRHCKMLPAKGNIYCAEHLCFQEDQEGVEKKRVKCPLDPSHTVFEERLEKHKEKCNSRKRKIQEFYEENINSGITDYEYTGNEKMPLNAVPTDELCDLIKRVNEYYSKLEITIAKYIGSHKVLKDELENQEYGPTTRKHFIQQASLINILEKSNVFHENTAFVEFGAGKGKLSHWLQKAVNEIDNVKYVLIDRQNTRNKFDCYHKGKDQGPSFIRLNIDIEHLNLRKVDHLNGRGLVGIGKHLCGGATDLSLRCLMELNLNQSNDAQSSKKAKVEESPHIELILFALCCFHRCSWPAYVGKNFFIENQFSPVDFHRMTSMCSWATCGFRKHEEGHNESHTDPTRNEENSTLMHDADQNDLKLSSDDKKNIGLKCKRLIDYGRMQYLKKHGYQSELFYYVDSGVTLEDVVLLAKKQY